MTVRHAGFEGRELLHLPVALALGVGLPLLHLIHAGAPGYPSENLYLALAVGVAASLQAVAELRKATAARGWASHAAAAASLLLILDPLVGSSSATPHLALLSIATLGALALVSAARLGQGIWMPVATLATALGQTVWAFSEVPERPVGAYPLSLAQMALIAQALTATLFTLWPLVAARRLRQNPWAWRSAAMAGSIWFPGLMYCWVGRFGWGQIGLLPLGLAVVSTIAGFGARRALSTEDATYKTALVWLFSVPVALVTAAVPLQLENESITIAWAVEGAALIYVWRRLDHAALKYVGLTLLAVATARLVVNPYVLDYHPRSATPVLNWLLYSYGVPALGLLAAWRCLQDLEVSRLRPWEGDSSRRPVALAAMASATAAIVVIFAWLNLTIIDAFSTGPQLHLLLERMPARDLTLSLAWALYALALLAIGMVRNAAALRWSSLCLIIVTLGKVFLYDLAHLHDLYRVASLVGLAFSLILISLAYQRFVFGKQAQPA